MIKIENISKRFNELKVLENLSFNVKDKEFLVILGPSGCGKTTLLRIIAGLEKPSKGKTIFSKEERFGFIFQESALFPWRTVKENISLGLEIKKTKNKEGIIKKNISLVGLDGFENYYPDELSGGMKQKTSLAQMLAINPSVLVMDEPFSSLDYVVRQNMEKELLKLWKKTRKTIIYVTHDINESLILATRIIVLSKRPARIKGEFLVKKKDEKSMKDYYERIRRLF